MTDPALARRAAPKGAPRRDKRAGQATARNAAAVASDEAARRQGDRVTIVGARGISPALSAAAIAAAAKVGAKSTIVNAGTLDLYDQRRFSGSAKIRTPIATTVRTTTTTALAPVTSTAAENTEPTATNSQTAGSVRSPILLITTTTVHEVLEIPVTPLSAEAVDPAAATALFGPEVGNTLAAGRAVLGETSANLRKAKVGDELRFIDWRGAELLLTVGAIVPDQKASNVEVLIPDVVAANAGSLRPQAVVIWNIPSRAQLNKELSSLPHNQVFRIRHSWDPPNVDAVLPAGDVKQLLGEFSITRHTSGLSLEAGWTGRNLVRAQLPLIGAFTCHKVVAAAARAALIEIQQRYLDGLINGPDSHRGGCFGAREIRTNVGTSGHDLSRHAWGAAIDLNPSTNRFGARPSIDPRIVEVFRRHGFAWGGSFMIPDGMHFEYIGAPRLDLLPPAPPFPPPTTTPEAGGPTSSTSATTTTTTTTLTGRRANRAAAKTTSSAPTTAPASPTVRTRSKSTEPTSSTTSTTSTTSTISTISTTIPDATTTTTASAVPQDPSATIGQ